MSAIEFSAVRLFPYYIYRTIFNVRFTVIPFDLCWKRLQCQFTICNFVCSYLDIILVFQERLIEFPVAWTPFYLPYGHCHCNSLVVSVRHWDNITLSDFIEHRVIHQQIIKAMGFPWCRGAWLSKLFSISIIQTPHIIHISTAHKLIKSWNYFWIMWIARNNINVIIQHHIETTCNKNIFGLMQVL